MTDAPKVNEIEAAARDAKRVRAAAEETQAERDGKWPLVPIGIGIGIGSAALAAALLYATRSRKSDV